MTLSDLYGQTIKQHNQFPIGENAVFAHTHSVDGYNRVCGDELKLYFQLLENGDIAAIGFHADACAICTASTSLLCEYSQQKNARQLQQDITAITQSIINGTLMPFEALKCLQAVSKHKTRINCALLPWQTLSQGLNNLTATSKSHSAVGSTNHA